MSATAIFYPARALSRTSLGPLSLSRLNSTSTSTTAQGPERTPNLGHGSIRQCQSSTPSVGSVAPPSPFPPPPPPPPPSPLLLPFADAATVNVRAEPQYPSSGSHLRPSPFYTRYGRRIPKLLVSLRDIGLAKDIPTPVRGKRNLVHTNPVAPKKRDLRRKDDAAWMRKHGKVDAKQQMSKFNQGLTYFEQVRQYKLHLGEIEFAKMAVKGKIKFQRRIRPDEELSLSSITREYMEAVSWFPKCTFSPFNKNPWGLRVHIGLDPDIVVITKTFTYHNRWFLASKGYDPSDVVVWGWVLASKDAEEAGWRMKLYQEGLPDKSARTIKADEVHNGDSLLNSPPPLSENNGGRTEPQQVATLPSRPRPFPTFLILHTLRRKPLSRTTINYFLSCGSTFLARLASDNKTKLLFIIRLLRRIQEENILALPYLSQLITSNLVLPHRCSSYSLSHLTLTYNRLLSLLARPAHDRPFQSHAVIQQSQFILLRQMSAMDIHLTREGYQALASVQLARAKTKEERDRIRGMKMSWPPWQEERDAWTDKVNQGRVTRAGVILKQMLDVGYPPHDWESAATVLAGQDTDSTPTIATRTFLRLPPSATISKLRTQLEGASEDMSNKTTKTLLKQKSQPYIERKALVWAARIRATRTLEEAWSIFLNARETFRTPTSGMYQELFEKVVAAERLQKQKGMKKQSEISTQGLEAPPGGDKAKFTPAPSSGEGISTIRALLTTPRQLTPQQHLQLLQNHANELLLKKIQEEKYRAEKPVPGEAKEVIPAPFSPSEDGVYTPIPPPTLGNLHQMLLQDGLKPTLHILALLIREAPDMETADSLLGEELKEQLWSGYSKNSREPMRLEKTNWRLLTAYLQALINSRHIERAIRLLIVTSTRKDNLSWHYPPAWNITLKAVADWDFRLGHGTPEKRISWLKLVWKLFQYMRALKVGINEKTLLSLCTAANKAITLEKEMKLKGGSGGSGTTDAPGVVFWDGVKPWVRVVSIFRNLVGNVQSQEDRDAELQALKGLANTEGCQDSTTIQTQTQSPPASPISVPFWAIFEELEIKVISMKETNSNIANETIEIGDIDSLDTMIDPAYYTPTPPPPPPPTPPLPTPEPNSSLKISRSFTPPLHVPSFASLHSYIRLLGRASQKDELLLTLAWMVRIARGDGNSSGINLPLRGTDNVGTTVGERRRARRCIVAARVFLEEEKQKEESETEGEVGVAKKGGEVEEGKGRWKEWCEVARVLVEGREMGFGGTGVSQGKLWGGWPGPDEVHEYKGNAHRVQRPCP